MNINIDRLKVILFYIFLSIAVTLILLSCNSEKKLTAKAETFTTKYPKKALPFFRGKFPCVTNTVITKVDDTAYRASIDSIKAVIEFYKAMLDAVEPTYIHDTINKAKNDAVCPDYRSEINRLNKLIRIKDAAFSELLKRVDSVKPVNNNNKSSIEDLSRISEMDIHLQEAIKKADNYAAKNKHRGKVMIWLSILLAALSIPYIIKAIKFFKL